MRAGGDEDAQTQEDPHAPGRWEGREGDQHEHGDRGEAGPPASLRVATITTVTFACMREVIRHETHAQQDGRCCGHAPTDQHPCERIHPGADSDGTDADTEALHGRLQHRRCHQRDQSTCEEDLNDSGRFELCGGDRSHVEITTDDALDAHLLEEVDEVRTEFERSCLRPGCRRGLRTRCPWFVLPAGAGDPPCPWLPSPVQSRHPACHSLVVHLPVTPR